MKKYFLLLLTTTTLVLFSCKKEAESNDNAGLSQDIKNFVPQSVIDSMRSWGLKINEGKKPPAIEGTYNISPNICLFDNSEYNRTGQTFASYRFRFRDQNNEKLTISLDYKTLNITNGDSAVGVGSFLSGNNNDFTVFVNASGIQYGIAYKQIGFYSGRKTENGIEDLQHGFYFTEKGADPENKLVKVGTSRIFYDSDQSSETNVVYRQSKMYSTTGASK